MTVLGLLLFLAAGAVGWLALRVDSDARRWSRIAAATSWTLSVLASLLLVVVGARALAGTGESTTLESSPPLGAIGLHVDSLTGLFLVITFGVAVPAFLVGLTRGGASRPRLGSAAALVGLAVGLVLTANDLFTLLAGWELLGFSFYLAVGYDRRRAGRGRAAVLAAGFSKTSGALLLLGGGVLAAQSGSIALSELGRHPGAWTALGYTLLLAGFAVKVGLVPAHVWLPPSYSAAPGPVRALLAGMAVNAGFYGLWRTLDVLGAPPTWLTCAVLLLAGVSAILGIAHAAVHADLRGLIAWSSVENAGVIGAGFAVALVGETIGSKQLVAVGLLAGTLQVITHAAAKSLLFISANAVEVGLGTTDLDQLRGVARTLPFTGVGLVVGGLTLAGMPLTAGFASEWMTLEALMQQFRVGQLPLQLCMAVCGILVALTIGVSGIAFVRLVGLTAFGKPANPQPAHREAERSWTHRAATGLLAAACLGVAAVAPLVVVMIAAGIRPIAGTTTNGALAGGWVLQPVFADFSALSPTLLWIVIPAYVVITIVVAIVFSGRRFWRVRRTPAWTSGSEGAPGRTGYTSYGFANPIRKVLAALLMTRHELRELSPDAGSSGGRPAAASARLGYVVDVTDVVQRYLYRPLLPAVRAVVAAARKLQSGRLDAYMAYMLIALLAVIVVVTALA
ncbi:proton-conducting transporter transmembrane domain-containing protein [Leifsonia shinshuensis]|uniref:NADH/ubiquinone/plastoquinone (Complex I) n=1 Tax=Leifsonia shinshuensis TaxID=150026 RepID=A0A7G6YEA8_9MICO|nr:proton-conducting transporter membrane subunit [Leifsonia shinshuensis]QNE36823.1 NADH/ubiquinone/plastoquinone (complex I) [Leifsonia shinshuensis]